MKLNHSPPNALGDGGSKLIFTSDERQEMKQNYSTSQNQEEHAQISWSGFQF